MKKSPLNKKPEDWNLQREDILAKARRECMIEMYAKAQPAYDLAAFFAEYDKHKDDPTWHHPDDDPKYPLYMKHYLSEKEFYHIRDRYIEAYGLKKTWEPNIELLVQYLKDGVYHDEYEYDENCTGHRVTRRLPSINDEIGEENAKKVEYLINECKNWFRFDREEADFSCAIALGGSPSSNKEAVKEYWKNNHGIDIEIVERDPERLWYYDNGWTDEEIDEEFAEADKISKIIE